MKQADRLILGHFITMDGACPEAEAVTVKDGLIQFVGTEDAARSLCGAETQVLDFRGQYLYPGFLEAHCHPGQAGLGIALDVNLRSGRCMADYARIMAEAVAANPGRPFYYGTGWHEWAGETPSAALLDTVSTEVPIVMQTVDGHSMLLNHKALKWAGFDEEAIRKWAPSMIRLDESGAPTGYISEMPLMQVLKRLNRSVEDLKTALLAFQQLAFRNGYTAVGDAGFEVFTPSELPALEQLQAEDRLRLRVYGWSLVPDNTPQPEAEIHRIAELARRCDGEYLRVLGAKVFLDGVVEAHTAWLTEDYADQPGYRGVERYNDFDSMARLVKAAGEQGMSVHGHCIGDGATKFFLDAAAEGQTASGNRDMRNAAAHLQLVRPEDVDRMAEYNVVAVAGTVWQTVGPNIYPQEVRYLGEERARLAYPSRSFLQKGAVVTTHTDFPVSPMFDVKASVYTGVTGREPGYDAGFVRNPGELLSREDMLKLMTVYPAWLFREENRMGTLTVGKLANMAVLDTDFLRCGDDEILGASVTATIVNGEIVYRKE